MLQSVPSGRKVCLILFLACLFISCASGNEPKQPASDKPVETVKPVAVPAGKVADTVVCTADRDQTYALYLPSYYTESRPFPCMIFLDAHARGSLPVRKYKALAEKYGFIIAGSNVSRNGLSADAAQSCLLAMKKDLINRLSVDSSRIYLSGFSGGARIAAASALADQSIAGVIGCSAGLPELQTAPRKFAYVTTAGDYDINWTELQHQAQELQQDGYVHQLITFPGIHSWPPAADFDMAMLWIQASAMKEHKQAMNDTLLRSLKQHYDSRIQAARTAGDLVTAQQLLAGALAIMDGLYEVGVYKDQLAKLTASPAYSQNTELQNRLLQTEQVQRQELEEQIDAQSLAWWNTRIARINKAIKTARQKQEADAQRRVLAYVGMMGYMYSARALKAGYLIGADRYLDIFKMADPNNPDCYYLRAIYHTEKGNKADAAAALMEAAAHGYDDFTTILNEPALQQMHSDEGFIKALDSMKKVYFKD